MDNESIDAQIEAMREFAQAVQHAGEIIAEALRPVIEAVMEIGRNLYDCARGIYHAHGTIYGDSHEGMMHWWDECLKIARLRQQAEYLERRHQMLAEIRTMRL